MIVSASTQTFDEVFIKNYNNLLKFCNNEEDRLHEKFIDIRQRLEVKPLTAHTITEIPIQLLRYIKTALYNNWKKDERLKKNNISPDECYWELEDNLLKAQELNQDFEDNQVQLEYMSMRLFEYIKLNYDKEWNYVFVTYYLYDANNKKITYAELSSITGYSISKCCKIIKTIKQDLKLNLIPYVNG